MLKSIAKYFIYRRRYPGVKFGKNVSLGGKVSFSWGCSVLSDTFIANSTLGCCCYVGGGSRLSNVAMGSFCSIAEGVLVGLGRHPTSMVSSYPGFYSAKASGSVFMGVEHPFSEHKQIKIGSDVWIGTRALICDGVSIGSGAVVGAGAVVTKDVEPYAIVGGVPSSLLRYRFEENIRAALLESAWWELPEKRLRKLANNFDNPENFLAAYEAMVERE